MIKKTKGKTKTKNKKQKTNSQYKHLDIKPQQQTKRNEKPIVINTKVLILQGTNSY